MSIHKLLAGRKSLVVDPIGQLTEQVGQITASRSFNDEKIGILMVIASTFLGIVVVELGWMVAEMGRQPWTIKNTLLTLDAVTKDHSVLTLGYLFPICFVVLLGAAVVSTVVVIKHFARKEFTL
jgi:cytochrome d ubiquinol oxidase subunit I